MASTIPGLVAIRIRGEMDSGPDVQNVIHAVKDSPPNTPTSMTSLAESVAGAVSDVTVGSVHWLTMHNTAYSVVAVDVDDLSPAGLASVSVDASGAGAQGGDRAPSDSAIVVTLRTGFSGRSQRGRLYIGGTDAGFLNADGTAWTSSAATNAEDSLNDLAAAIAAEGYTWVVYSRVLDAANEITSWVGRTYLATQRRRRAGFGS